MSGDPSVERRLVAKIVLITAGRRQRFVEEGGGGERVEGSSRGG